MGIFDLKGYSIRNQKLLVVKNLVSKTKNLSLGRFSQDPSKAALSKMMMNNNNGYIWFKRVFDYKLEVVCCENVSSKIKNLGFGRFSQNLGNLATSPLHWAWCINFAK